MSEAKPFVISKWQVMRAFELVKANAGAAGVDKQSLSDYVKGCQMPALYARAVGTGQNSGGRRRTSLEGGNRGMRSGESGSATVYGDLNGRSALNLASKPIDWAVT